MINIYSSSSCPMCTKTKRFLKSKGIEYNDINVENNDIAKKELLEKSNQLTIPVLDINGDIVVGFNKKRIEELLGGI